MDENTVRGWLKDHKNDLETLVHQQAVASQSQYKALRSELREMLRSELQEMFEESIKNSFGPSKYEDPQGALLKLLQLGLKLHIQRELLVSRQALLRDAFVLARITEARLEDQTALTTGTITKLATSMGTQKPAVPRLRGPLTPISTAKSSLFLKPTGTSKPLAIKWISLAKRQERINKGLCFNCDNQWTREHKCLGKFLLLMTKEEDDMGVATRDGREDAVESRDISILNSLIGHGSPRSLQLWGKISKGDVHVLIDNGSTHNFIRPDVVEKICLPIKSTKAFKVYIGSGESLLCESVCSSVTLHMQGVVMEVDLYVLPMQGPDVVLGIQWLQNIGKVTHDYAHQTIEFTLLDTTYSLKGDDSLRMKKISLHQMQAMLEHNNVYGVYEVYHLSIETEVPTTLPPHHSIDHRTYLLPKTKPVNVRPYRYPHYQKEEMEKLVNEMLSQVEYKPGVANQIADALSRMYEDGELVKAEFMAISQPIVGLLGNLKSENETLEELQALHQQLDTGSGPNGFRREQGLFIFRNRYYAVGSYLQPLPTLEGVWEDVSMDFIIGFPLSKGFTAILVVVDRFSKNAYFGVLPTNFNGHKVSELFMEIVVKHHGIPKTIVSDRDSIFVSKFWKELFWLSGKQLNHSTAYDPQSDGQTEAVNRGLEQYLRAMVLDPLYDRLHLSLIPYPPGASKIAAVDELLMERNEVGDKVFVKLQPYRQITLAKRLSNKLAKRFYGPYEIVERIGKVAYPLPLPVTSKIHPVFHVSILKLFTGTSSEMVTELPDEFKEGQPMEQQPVGVCNSRMVLQNGKYERQVLFSGQVGLLKKQHGNG
ncbi:ty3-gypsy retrotransposon protein [Tanacetum coccineum]